MNMKPREQLAGDSSSVSVYTAIVVDETFLTYFLSAHMHTFYFYRARRHTPHTHLLVVVVNVPPPRGGLPAPKRLINNVSVITMYTHSLICLRPTVLHTT